MKTLLSIVCALLLAFAPAPQIVTPAPSSGGVTVVAGNLTAQQANVSNTTLVTPGANGFFRASCWIIITQAATTSSTLPQCNIIFSEPDANTTPSLSLTATSAANTVGTLGPIGTGTQAIAGGFFAKSGAVVQWSTSGYVSTGATPMQYAVHFRLEGPF